MIGRKGDLDSPSVNEYEVCYDAEAVKSAVPEDVNAVAAPPYWVQVDAVLGARDRR